MLLIAPLIFLNLIAAPSDTAKPVIRLDEVYIQGTVQKPPVIELEASKLDEKLQAAALQNLIRLEKKILKPADLAAVK